MTDGQTSENSFKTHLKNETENRLLSINENLLNFFKNSCVNFSLFYRKKNHSFPPSLPLSKYLLLACVLKHTFFF